MTPIKAASKLLTTKQILDAPEKDYMNVDQLAFFKHLLLELYESTLARVEEAKNKCLLRPT
jgi:hypothetical protein